MQRKIIILILLLLLVQSVHADRLTDCLNQNKNQEDYCISREAELTKNSELCDQIKDDSKRITCYRMTPPAFNEYWIQTRALQIIPWVIFISYLLFVALKKKQIDDVSKKKRIVHLGLLFIFVLVFTIAASIVNPGYRFKIISVLLSILIFSLILVALGKYLVKKIVNPSIKGLIYGGIVGILALCSSINWYGICYRRWCDSLQTLNILSYLFLPSNYVLRSLNSIDPIGLLSATLNFLIFILIGAFFGYIYNKNKKLFWIFLIIFIILYVILSLIVLVLMFQSFG